ncbi:MAG: hypothetical protein QME59_08100 [Candidatus Hydrothermarchaeota archaeon]|nr:hypothetical protein [Candidatus Hydrothermarchaeota archaeon]
MISEKKIVAELSEKLVQSGLYTTKKEEVEELAKKLKFEIKKVTDRDFEKVREILSKGEPLSKIVIQTRGTG